MELRQRVDHGSSSKYLRATCLERRGCAARARLAKRVAAPCLHHLGVLQAGCRGGARWVGGGELASAGGVVPYPCPVMLLKRQGVASGSRGPYPGAGGKVQGGR